MTSEGLRELYRKMYEGDEDASLEGIRAAVAERKGAVPEGQRPQAVLLIGKPEAGKTQALNQRMPEFGEVTRICADDLRAELPEYRGWNAVATGAESKMITTELTKRAVLARHNIVLDEAGANGPKMLTKAKELNDAGYDVHVIHVDAPLHQKIPRSWKRFQEEGKFIDLDYQLYDVDDKPIETYKALRTAVLLKRGKMLTTRTLRVA